MTEEKQPEEPVTVRELPVIVRLAVDVIMLRSTLPTAIAYTVLWAIVAGHILYECDYFAKWGIESPSTAVKHQFTWHLGTDIRYEAQRLCYVRGQMEREDLINHIDRLQTEYVYLAGHNIDVLPCVTPAPPQER